MTCILQQRWPIHEINLWVGHGSLGQTAVHSLLYPTLPAPAPNIASLVGHPHRGADPVSGRR
ncbi:MAG: hypothetical protein ACRDBQ_16810 [Shewanella sp.]